ncbi:hypothetical protein HPB50_019888 [Hyalomma asiaticum]|uniref:Uncharacterized protein n=1 Tax=Hyalomma asiaticum TaxID=266040 RepID=A0ACB7SJX6_HYAAI|nr:hypothetical protein HPB50_019888 [Hyalomma asiaticum]
MLASQTTAGIADLQDADDSYDILSESGFDHRFKKPNRKPSGDRGGNRRQQQGSRSSSRPQGSSRPAGSRPNSGRDSPRGEGGSPRPLDFPRNEGPRGSSGNDRGPSRFPGGSPSRSQDRDRGSSSSGRRPQYDDDFTRGDSGSSRPGDFPRNDNGPRDSSRNDRGPSRSRGDSPSRTRDRNRGSSSSGRRPQHDDDGPLRGQGSRDEEGFQGRPEFSRGIGNPTRGSNRPEIFPQHERVHSPEDFVVHSGPQQRPRGNSQTQGFEGPQQFPIPQQPRGPQQRFPEEPQRSRGPNQFSGSEQLNPGPQQRFPIPEQQPFPRDQEFAGGSLEPSFPGQVSRSQEFPRRQEFPDGSGRLTLLPR